MTDTRKLTVAVGEQLTPVGTLHFDARGQGREVSTFRYRADWLVRENAFAISPWMPLSEAPYTTSKRPTDGSHARSLAGPVADSCPDAWGQRVLARDARTGGKRAMTDLDYLVGVADATRMGALRYLDENGVPLRAEASGRPIAPAIFELAELQRSAVAFEWNSPLAEDWRRLIDAGTSLGGARPKCCVVNERRELLLAKFTSAHDTNRAIERAEVATLKLAASVGLNAPQAELLVVDHNTPVALIHRFDRVGSGRRHFVSGQTFLNAGGADEGTYTALAEAIRAHGADTAADLKELYNRIAFSILVRNTDDHLKNHGFLMTSGGKWRLSPVFDVNPQPDRHPQLKTAISDEAADASIETLLDHCVYFDMTTNEARETIAAMAETISTTWKNLFERQGMSRSDLQYYFPAFEHDDMNAALALKTTVSRSSSPSPM